MNYFTQITQTLKRCLSLLLIVAGYYGTYAQSKNNFSVIAYYAGGPDEASLIPAEKLTHIIFSFCHLKGNQLQVDHARDSATIKNLVALKQRNPRLKVMLSLGGWGGCASCADVFSTETGRNEFALSVLALNQYFKCDGLDLDWEYPAIEGYPGHPFMPEDKRNFTDLVKALRKTLGKRYEISFAAGGFQKFLDESIAWSEVMPLVDRVNLMSYDLINGYAIETGHHAALYSRAEQTESTDHAVQYLIRLGVPRNKIVIGAAFYGRVWQNVSATKNGLYQAGEFKTSIDYKNFQHTFTPEKGFVYYWDDVVKAPYLYSASEKLFVTYDDRRSIGLKTQYVMNHQLGGIMFWELTGDVATGGLLDAIVETRNGAAPIK